MPERWSVPNQSEQQHFVLSMSVEHHRCAVSCSSMMQVFLRSDVSRRCETVIVACTNATCSNNGVCYIDASTGSGIPRCICATGYTGQYCQSPLNPCSSNPCQLNGTCLLTSNSSYQCICANGVVGSSCTTSTFTLCRERTPRDIFSSSFSQAIILCE